MADPGELRELNQLVIQLNKRDTLYIPFPEEQVRRNGKTSCYQCGLDCIMRNTLRTASGKDYEVSGGGATYSACEYITNGLLYAMETRQPIAMLHEISRLTGFWVIHQADPKSSPVSSDVFRAAAARFWGIEQGCRLEQIVLKNARDLHLCQSQ